jgi:chromosome segregation ATPase
MKPSANLLIPVLFSIVCAIGTVATNVELSSARRDLKESNQQVAELRKEIEGWERVYKQCYQYWQAAEDRASKWLQERNDCYNKLRNHPAARCRGC